MLDHSPQQLIELLVYNSFSPLIAAKVEANADLVPDMSVAADAEDKQGE